MEFLASNWLIANKNRHIFILFLFFLQVSAQQNPTVTEKPKTVDSLRIQSDSVQNHLPAKAKQGFFRH
ncbi:MAG: hypothetical protein NZ108_10980, partial [Bacteroidia bacterium]|nr:hypothetical protein [Bacteroidia bacterium]